MAFAQQNFRQIAAVVAVNTDDQDDFQTFRIRSLKFYSLVYKEFC